MGKGGLPERWENYSNIGEVIEGTRFVPFKVPLNEHLLAKVPKGVDRNWGLEHLKESCPKLALIVDLTNTSRYYSGHHAQQMGFKYAKIMTPGHEVPGKAVVERFYHVVSEVLDTEGEGVVGVHCTHGLNRTGYLICRYMVEKLGVDPEEAISAFDGGRGHKQERANYLEHLRNKKWETEEESIDGNSGPGSQDGMTYGQYKKMKIQEEQNLASSSNSQTHQQSFSNPHPRQQSQHFNHRQSHSDSWNSGGFGHNFSNMNIRGAPARGRGGAWQGDWRGNHRGSRGVQGDWRGNHRGSWGAQGEGRGNHRGSWGDPSQQRNWRGSHGRGGGSSFQDQKMSFHFSGSHNDSGYGNQGRSRNRQYDSRNEGNMKYGRQMDDRLHEGRDGSTEGDKSVNRREDSRGHHQVHKAGREIQSTPSNAGSSRDSGRKGPQQINTPAHSYATRNSLSGEGEQEAPSKERKKRKKKNKSDPSQPGENERSTVWRKKKRQKLIQSEGGIFI